MTEIEKRLNEIEARYIEGPGMVDAGSVHLDQYLSELSSIARAALKREAALEQQNNDLAARHAALLVQNVREEEEIADLERQVCGMREALELASRSIDQLESTAAFADLPGSYRLDTSTVILQALASAPKCRHEEEVQRLEKRWGESVDLVTEVEERAQKAEAELARMKEEKSHDSRPSQDR